MKFQVKIGGVSTDTTTTVVNFADAETEDLSFMLGNRLHWSGGVWRYYSTTIDAKATTATPRVNFKWIWQLEIVTNHAEDDKQHNVHFPRVFVDSLNIKATEKPSTQIYETGLIAYQAADEKIQFDESGLDILSTQGTISVSSLKTPTLLLDNASGSNPSISPSTTYISGSILSIIGSTAHGRSLAGSGNPSGDLVLQTSAGGAATGSNYDGGDAGNIYQYLGKPGQPVGTGASGSYGKVFMGYDSSSLSLNENLLNIRHVSSSIGLQYGRPDNSTNATANEIIGKIDFIDGDGTVKNSIKSLGQNGQFILEGGNVGIGNTAPPYELTVEGQISASHSGNDNPTLYIRNTNGDGDGTWNNGALIQSWVGDTDGIDLRNTNDGDYFLGNNQQGNGIFMYDGTGGVCLTYAGSVVCRVDSSGGLEVASGALGVGATPSGTGGHIRASNDIVAFYSDERLKEKITIGIENPIDKIKNINTFTYRHNELANTLGFVDDKIYIGVGAKAVKESLPEAVEVAPFDANEDGSSKSGEDYLTVQYERLVPLLIEAIKEQQVQIDELKQEIKEIKNGTSK